MECEQDKKEAFALDIEDSKYKGFGYRHQQCILLFFTLTFAYSMRTCMGMALVVMTDMHHDTSNATVIHVGNNTFGNEHANSTDENSGILHSLLLVPPYPVFKWNKKIQNTIQSSFFWGYMLTQIPAGSMVYHFGSTHLLITALFINGVVSFCLPWAAFYGGWILTGLFRFAQGLSQACIIPGMHTLFGKWAPIEERGRMTAFAYGGQALGAMMGFPVTGFISSSYLGWPGIFRFYGIIVIVIGCFLWMYGADSPAQHKFISFAERQYIEQSLGQVRDADKKKKKSVPWSKILRCRGLYAIMFAHMGHAWCTLTLFSEVPAYMGKVMGVNIKANGLLSALPFLVMWITNFMFPWLSDKLIAKKIVNITVARKAANSLGVIPAAVGFILLAHSSDSIYAVEVLLCFICAFKSACIVGFQVNHIDISPNFSGTMLSITNFAANCFGSIAPVVTGFILTDVSDEHLWQKVFYLSAIVYLASNIAYVIMGTGERADWDEADPEPPEKESMINEKDVEKKTINS